MSSKCLRCGYPVAWDVRRQQFGRLCRRGFTPEQATELMLPTELERSLAGFSPMMKASMANDLHAGNRLELDWLAGKVVALGRKYGIPTPGQEAVYAILKPYRMGRER